MQNYGLEVNDEYDREFIVLVMGKYLTYSVEIEKRYDTITKHNKLKIDSWCKKLSQITNNKEWKKNRNLHTILILDMLINNKFESPYNRFAPEGSVPIISKAWVKSRLSNKFYEMSNKELNELNSNEVNKRFNNVSPVEKEQEGEEEYFTGKKVDLTRDNDLEALKMTITKMKNDLKMKDDIIKRQNDERLRLENRVDELEKILQSLVNLER